MIEIGALIYILKGSNIYTLMDSSYWFDTLNLGGSIVYISGSQVIIFS